MKSYGKHIIFWLIWSLGLGLIGLFLPVWDDLFRYGKLYGHDGIILALNLLPFFLLGAFLMGLLRKPSWAFVVGTSLVLLLGTSTAAMLFLRQEGLAISDFALIPTLLKTIPEYIDLIPFWAYMMPFLIVGSLVALSRFLPGKLSLRERLVYLSFSLLIGTALMLGPYRDSHLYVERPLDHTGIALYIEDQNYKAHGAPYAFLHSAKATFQGEKYDKDLVAKRMAPYAQAAVTARELPNIYVFQMESFKDFSDERDLPWLEGSPYVYWEKMKAEGQSGRMLATVYGGGTIQTEMRVLTPASNIPRYDRSAESVVSFLKDQGYYTEAFHPNYGGFYNRTNRYRHLGFDEFFHSDNYFFNEGEAFDYLDADLYQTLLTHGKVHRRPYFGVGIGIQNHGPYVDHELLGAEWLRNKEGVPLQDYYLINNYFNGVYEASKAAYDFTRELSETDVPSICLFYGDHPPSLYSGVYDLIGYSDQDDAGRQLRETYATPYLFWANPAAQASLGLDFPSLGEGPDLESYFLIPYLFGEVGLLGSPQLAYLKDMSQLAGVYREEIACVNGSYITTIPEALRQEWELFDQVEIANKKK